ncbi:restriction endonuclease subunit S [Priestia aryabhattai]|uniref:restriction endonuclease subunit S n=1 Tax=Priestia aryabhattai TaxID=412384 RepID=UPI003CEED96E
MENNYTPEIRFAGFTEDWEERKLGEIYTERKERGYDSLPILSVSIHHGVSNEELDSNTLGKKVRRSEDKSLYKHVYFGDLVLNMMRAWQGAIGVVKSEGMVSPAYITAIPSAQLYPLFMDYCLRREDTIIQMDSLSYGVTDFRKRLYWDSFINVLCRIPSVPEQERITAFFTQLDNLINLRQQELTTLRQTKQGFLQKMFPKEGESVPGIRFPGFTGDWEERKLDSMVERLKSYSLSRDVETSGYTGYKYIHYGDIHTKVADIIDESSNLPNIKAEDYEFLQKGDLVLADASEDYQGIAKPAVITIDTPYKLVSGLHTIALRPKQVDSLFLYYLFNSPTFRKYGYRVGTGMKVFGISATNLLKFESIFPSLEEQTKIGNFFKQLDDTIALHQRELDILKETKKAFLQKMFA